MPETYIELARRFRNIGADIDDLLDILELFAQKQYLTIAQITFIIRSTELEIKYPNVYKKVKKLEQLDLIECTKGHKTRHNEKEEGIYQLFLKRLDGILADQKEIYIIIKRA